MRPGGDEFCVVAPETSAEDAAKLIAAIRGALATLDAAGRAQRDDTSHSSVGLATRCCPGCRLRPARAQRSHRAALRP